MTIFVATITLGLLFTLVCVLVGVIARHMVLVLALKYENRWNGGRAIEKYPSGSLEQGNSKARVKCIVYRCCNCIINGIAKQLKYNKNNNTDEKLNPYCSESTISGVEVIGQSQVTSNREYQSIKGRTVFT